MTILKPTTISMTMMIEREPLGHCFMSISIGSILTNQTLNPMEQLTEFDYGIAEYIWKILKTQQPIVWSWGVDPDSVKTIKNGTQFHVQGFLMTGTVKITYDEGHDLFNLEFLPDDETKPKKTIEGLYLDQLVFEIDENVEHCENYEQRVNEECGIIVIP